MASRLTRRQMLIATGATTALAMLPQASHARPADGPLAAAQSFLASLPEDAAAAARFPFRGDIHRAWNFMGTGAKPGLMLERMTQDQAAAADALLRTLLSAEGHAKARLIMAMQDVMRELGRGPSNRSSQRFSLALFGEPGDGALWGVRIEGHHLSLNWTLKGDEIVAVTPASFSVIPQSVPIGAHKGRLVLDAEETLARRLITDLAGAKRERALIGERAFGNVLALAGREDRFNEKQGLPAADMSAVQQDLLWELIETTGRRPWPASVAPAQAARLREGDAAAVHFAWAGGVERGDMFYYRIHGDTFTLELATVLGDPEHLHAVFHDPDRTFGRHMV